MKNLTKSFAVLAVVLGSFISSSPVKGAAIITASITITNPAGIGTNWTVNGNSRTWTNAAGTPAASWIITGATAGATATNLYNSIIRYPYTGPFVIISRSSPTNFTLTSTDLTVTTNNYFTLSYTTNSGTNLNVVTVPFENLPGATNRTNNAHWLVDALNRFPYTNAFATNANVITNLLVKGAQPFQEVLGPVGFRGRFSVNSNFFATNGFTKSITNIDPVTSNLVNYGNAIRSEGPGGNSFQIGSNAIALGTRSVSIGNSAFTTNTDALAVGTGAIATNTSAIAVGSSAITHGDYAVSIGTTTESYLNGTALGYGASAQTNGIALGRDAVSFSEGAIAIGFDILSAAYRSIAIGPSATADGAFGMALGAGASSGYSNSAAIGPPDHLGNVTTTTTTNQIVIGTANHNVVIPGRLYVLGTSIHDARITGTNRITGSISYTRTDLSSIANGNNISVPVGTNRYVKLSGTVSASPSICGMIGAETAGGAEGQELLIQNTLGYAVTFAVNTVDPVPANRINTPTGSDVSIPDQGFAGFIYDSGAARWKLIACTSTNLTATATNAITSVMTNGAYILGSGATNLHFTTGITGYVSGSTVLLGVNLAPGSSTNQLISTNGTTLGTSVGTVAWENGVTGYVAGAVAHLGVNATGSGEVNVTGEVSVTNATRFGWTHSKSGVTNLLRSLSPGNGLVGTNQSTNISLAMDPAIIASQANLTAASNALAALLSGEANVNGEVSVTNGTRFGLVNGKAGVTNLLRSIAARNGLVGTNESGTNISFAIDPAVVASQDNLTAASNDVTSAYIDYVNTSVSDTSAAIIALFVTADTNKIDKLNGRGTNTAFHQTGSAVALTASPLIGSSTNRFQTLNSNAQSVVYVTSNDVFTASNAAIKGDLTASAKIYDLAWSGDYALYSDSTGYIRESAVGSTELGYLSGVTSALQTQLNAKVDESSGVATNLGAWQTLTVKSNVTIQGVTGTGPPVLKLLATNGNNGITFSVPLNAATTNNIVFDPSVFVAGHVLKVHAVSGQTVTLTNDVDNNSGGSGLATNANQFGASTTLTLKSGLLTTNQIHDGPNIFNGTNQPGYSNYLSGLQLTITNSFDAPTNTAQEAGIRLVGSAYSTGTGFGVNHPVMEMVWRPTIQPASSAAAGTLTFQSRTNETGIPSTNMQIKYVGGTVGTAVGIGKPATDVYSLDTAYKVHFGGDIEGTAGLTIGGLNNYFAWTGGPLMQNRTTATITFYDGALADFQGFFLGGQGPTNGLIQFISSSTGNSNSTINLRSGNTNVWLKFGSHDIGTHSTNWTADATSFPGYTNTTTYNQIWNVRGTSGNIVFWNRTGLTGATAAGIAIWTNTVIATGSDIVIGVNCGIAVDTGVSVVGGGRAF